FSERTRDKEISKALGLESADMLDDYLENHISWTYAKDDIPLFYNNDTPTIKKIEKEGYAFLDEKNDTVYDRWGMGVLRGEDGFFSNYGVLMKDKELDKKAREFLPEHLVKLMDMPLEKAVEAYEAPDPLSSGNDEWFIRDKDGVEGDLCVIPSGYFGIYERAYALMGWENYMTEIAGNPKMVYSLMEKITDYRIKLAKVKADLGYKIVHHGDDLGTQCSGFFSKKMFEEMLLPHYKKLFGEYKKNGQYIMMHSCGSMISYLPQLIDAGLDGWEPVQPCNDLRYVKKEYGKDLVFMGGIDTQSLPFLKPDEVKKMAREAIEILGKGGGYIIAPSQEIMGDVPLDNVVAILETVVEMRDKVM
ncbi:MAG: uroporphyrinogen decarboxylase family protein, partial [Christensenellaceae bacterium]